MSSSYSIRLSDKIISCLTYLTTGWAGVIYFVYLYLRKKVPSRFLRYNVFQAIFISLLFFLVSEVVEIMCNFLSVIPIIKVIVLFFVFIFNRPVLFQYSLIQVFIIGLFLYMALWSLMGRYPKVVWVSKIIQNAAQ